MYQAGGLPGHRAEEMVFCLKSVVARQRSLGKMVIIQSYDVSKFFDKENIDDGAITCLKRGANPKAVRLWYKMNENTQIKVKTGAGISSEAKVGAVIGQGTISGALVSQAVLDEAVMEHFEPGDNLQIDYGTVPMAPLMWVDDMLNATGGLKEAREVNSKVDTLMKQRSLNLNEDKSVCIIIGTKKQKQETTKQMAENPLMCGSFETKEKQEDKWLGQILSAKGLTDSVARTVATREGKIKGACLEISLIVNDWRARAVGGMESALMLWQTCAIPSLLHGAGTWQQMSKQTEKQLNSLQNWFLRLMLQVGPGAPLPSLLWETGLLDMGLLVWIEKIMLILHIRNLEETAIARKIYEEQKKNNWPGLVIETEEICKELKIESVNTTKQNKKQFRKVVTEACHKLNEERLRKEAENKVKCQRIMKEPYGRKKYIGGKIIHNVREQYRTRVGLQAFAGNYSHDMRFSKTQWKCRCDESIESEAHLMNGQCPVYGNITEKYADIENNDENLIRLFNEILKMRDALEEEDKKEEKEREEKERKEKEK